jgi:hypothetical protein
LGFLAGFFGATPEITRKYEKNPKKEAVFLGFIDVFGF